MTLTRSNLEHLSRLDEDLPNSNPNLVKFGEKLKKNLKTDLTPKEYLTIFKHTLNECKKSMSPEEIQSIAEDSFSITRTIFPRSFARRVEKLIMKELDNNPDPFDLGIAD